MIDERKKESPKLAVVVPCYNEEAVIGETLIELLGMIPDLKYLSGKCPLIYIKMDWEI